MPLLPKHSESEFLEGDTKYRREVCERCNKSDCGKLGSILIPSYPLCKLGEALIERAIEVSPEFISNVTDKIIDEVNA
ncbi:MAG: hypothetical protein LBC25_01220 [Holosporales bacterium]|jgi:hypothetical protein|nr:hypothetical protein [Holosporales bacterium]